MHLYLQTYWLQSPTPYNLVVWSDIAPMLFTYQCTLIGGRMTKNLIALCVASLLLSGTALAAKVNITKDLASVSVKHTDKNYKTKTIVIKRNQDNKNTISKHYALTSRACPPFCIQPMKSFAPHQVEVLGETEVLSYIQKMQKSSDYMLIDSRTADWVFLKSGTIPGAVNIPWTKINPAKGATAEQIKLILEDEFRVITSDEGPWSFSNAKTLILFCNGMWCGQSPSNIRTLLALGYPAAKIKWYRGGMQNWETLGLTTVKSARSVQ